MRKTIITALIFFVLGFAMADLLAGKNVVEEDTAVDRVTSMVVFTPVSGMEKPGPRDHISEDKIHVYEGKVIIDADLEWSRFTDTNSMDPLIDIGANGLEIKPKSESEIGIGDVIAYKADGKRIIHRVVAKGSDDEGNYFVTKGDNNKNIDDVKVRFSDVTGILVGIIY